MAAQIFDWSHYLRLARELAARNEEACLRSSISRAYYYIFNIALQRAEMNDFVLRPGESTHLQLWRLFTLSPEPECVRLGQMAQRLKERRERADYRSTYVRIEEEVPEVLSQAEDFGRRLQGLPARHPNPTSVRL
jgi:uncharacterized protein (UPF0332 family)